jgi:hypothetical protein
MIIDIIRREDIILGAIMRVQAAIVYGKDQIERIGIKNTTITNIVVDTKEVD